MAIVFADANAYAMGNVAGTYAITGSSTDKLAITIDGGSVQNFTLTTGAARTAAQIVTDLSGLTGATASVITIGTSTYVQIKTTSASNNSSTILIGAPANNANAVLGFIATTYKGGIVTDGATSTGTFTGATKQNIIDGLEDALNDAGWITVSGHHGATVVMQCSVTPSTAGSLIGQIQIKSANTNCVSINIQNISGTKVGGNSTSAGFMLLPAAAKVFKVIACKHQFFIFTAGSTTTAREFACAGVLYVPSFMQGASGVYEAIWGHGNAQSDTDTTGTRPSFRTQLDVSNQSAVSYNQQMIVNGTISELANATFTPGGGSDHGPSLQHLVGVSIGTDDQLSPLKPIGPRWWDGSYDTIDPILAFGVSPTAITTLPVRVGLLWNAAIIVTDFTADLTDTFNGHNWWFLTSSNVGTMSSPYRPQGTLILATS